MANQNSAMTDTVPVGSDTYSDAMLGAKNYIAWITDEFSAHLQAPVLEVGIGHGSYAETLQTYGPYIGVDIDTKAVDEARQRYPGRDFSVADITDPGFPRRMAAKGLRSIVCSNVLEHIQDHQRAVDNMAGALVPGGHLLIIVPALPMLYNDLDRLAGHVRRYRRADVRGLLANAGLAAVRVDYFNPLGGLGWLANRMLRHDSLNATAVNRQITLFDRWIVPLSRLADPLTRRCFGQSVLAVGRKL